MRNATLLNNVDASVQQISEPLNLDKRTEWKIYINASGLDGTPQFYLEDNSSGSKCIDPAYSWNIICNRADDLDYFPISETVLTIEKKDFKANWMRVRVEPNDNTTGTIDVRITYKTYP